MTSNNNSSRNSRTFNTQQQSTGETSRQNTSWPNRSLLRTSDGTVYGAVIDTINGPRTVSLTRRIVPPLRPTMALNHQTRRATAPNQASTPNQWRQAISENKSQSAGQGAGQR